MLTWNMIRRIMNCCCCRWKNGMHRSFTDQDSAEPGKICFCSIISGIKPWQCSRISCTTPFYPTWKPATNCSNQSVSWIWNCVPTVSISNPRSLPKYWNKGSEFGKFPSANAECDVTVYHCRKSDGGLFFSDYKGFEKCLNIFLSDRELSSKIGQNGYSYLKENFTWPLIVDRFLQFTGITTP